jgi:hypothetical protein
MATDTANAAQRESKAGSERMVSPTLICRSTYQKQAALTINLPAKNKASVKALFRAAGDAPIWSASLGALCTSVCKWNSSTADSRPAAANVGSDEPRRTVFDRRSDDLQANTTRDEKIELLADGLAQLRERGGRLFLLRRQRRQLQSWRQRFQEAVRHEAYSPSDVSNGENTDLQYGATVTSVRPKSSPLNSNGADAPSLRHKQNSRQN